MKSILLLAFFAVSAFSQNYKISDNAINAARILNDYLINTNFDRAYQFSDSLLQNYPEEPLFFYLKVASIGLKNLDFNEVLDREMFFDIYNRGMRLVDYMLLSDPKSCDLIMIRGFLMSASAAFMLLEGRFAAGARLGLQSLEVLRDAHACDPNNYDTKYYLGFFDYAQAELRRRLGPLGALTGFPRNAQQGIDALQRCVRYARFMNRAAEMVLVDVFVRENRLNDASQMLTQLLAEFEESRFLMWTQKRYFIARGYDLAAVEVAMRAAKLYFRDGGYHNGINILEETRRQSNFRRLPPDIRRQIAEFEPLINRERISSSTWRVFRNLARE